MQANKYNIWEIPFSDIRIKVNNNIYNLHKNIIMYSGKLMTLIQSNFFDKESNIYTLDGEDESKFLFIIEILYNLYNNSFFDNLKDKYESSPNNNISAQIDIMYILDEYMISVKSIWKKSIQNFFSSMSTIYYDHPSNIDRDWYDKKSIREQNAISKQYKKDIDTFNTVIYDRQFYHIIKKYGDYENYGKYPNLTEMIISINDTDTLCILSLLDYPDLKNYPFIIYFLYDLCLKTRNYANEIYHKNILSQIKHIDNNTDCNIMRYINNICDNYTTEILAVHDSLKISNYPGLRSSKSVTKYFSSNIN